MPSRPSWKPIYPGKNHLDPDTWNKIGSVVPRRDWQLINSITGQSGTISFIIDHAIAATASAIRKHKLSYADSEEFIEWLCERGFTEFRERPTCEPSTAAQGATGDDRRRETEGGDRAAHPSDVATGAGQSPATASSGDLSDRGRSRLDKLRAAKEKAVGKGREG